MTPTDVELDPRVERSRRLICAAALDELGEVGYGAMTIESIARRAGVGKATIYRHWNGKLDLVASAVDMIRERIEIPEHGRARDRVLAMLTSLADNLVGSQLSSCLPAIVSAAQYDTALRDFHLQFSAQRCAALQAVLAEGVAAGEFDVDVPLAAEMLVGPIFFRRLMTAEPFPVEMVPDLVRSVLGPERSPA